MPLPRHTYLHPEAVVTPSHMETLTNYLLSVEPGAPAAQSNVEAADSQYRQWIAAAGKLIRVDDAPNGIAFLRTTRTGR